jgi:hypothetical protein
MLLVETEMKDYRGLSVLYFLFVFVLGLILLICREEFNN